MPPPPDITILSVDHGLFPGASSFNLQISPEEPLLLAGLSIHWEETKPRPVLVRIEKILAAFSSSFSAHQCRGPHSYRIFGPSAPKAPASHTHPRGNEGQGPGIAHFDPCLALAHLIEHAIIDIQCSITDQPRCSGFTGGHREPPDRYDLMVECPHYLLGRFCLALAVTWVTSAAMGHELGREERLILSSARRVFRMNGRAWTSLRLARELEITEGEADRALKALTEVGFLAITHWPLNFSGLRQYHLADGSPGSSTGPEPSNPYVS